MFKNFKRFLQKAIALMVMLSITTVFSSFTANAAENDTLIINSTDISEKTTISSLNSSYSLLKETVLSPGAGTRSASFTMNNNSAKQVRLVGGLNGGYPSGSTYTVQLRLNNSSTVVAEYLVAYGSVFDANLPSVAYSASKLRFTITPSYPYNGSSYTYHYYIGIYG